MVEEIEETLYKLCRKKYGESVAGVQVTELLPGSVKVNFAVVMAEVVEEVATSMSEFLNEVIQSGSYLLSSLSISNEDLVKANGENVFNENQCLDTKIDFSLRFLKF